ncbi:MAG: GGDEF domain-containing protein [Planctomycetes bacterium]|nr:GGDEF domain-containing protein [Planctomycetota bacterium]
MENTTLLTIGVLVGAVELGIGILVGMRIARRQTPEAQLAESQLQQARDIVGGLGELADTIGSDVARYRARMERVSNELVRGQKGRHPAPPEVVQQLVEQLTLAMDRLQQRLTSTEDRLKQQTSQIDAYLSEARTDPLTGLSNRRAFDEELTKRLAQWKRGGTPVSLVIVDVDRFKEFNDRHGHVVGDAVLKQVAGVLKGRTRAMDLVSRIGGEEFAFVLPGTSLDEARQATESIRLAVARGEYRYEGRELNVTISAGVAAAQADESPTSLLERSDAALYASKAAGRDCAHYHDGQNCWPVIAAGEDDLADPELLDACDDLRMAVAHVGSDEKVVGTDTH